MAVRAFVGLGSNLGDRPAQLAAALAALDAAEGIRVLGTSQVYESEPWGVADQPPFANAVAELEVAIAPEELLAVAKSIERRMGREAGVRFGPRPIDVDILLYGDETIETPSLTVPHPRMLERDFVVTPLLELAPGATLPNGTRPSRESATEGRVTGVIGSIPRA